jgi:hypothetical protein
MCILGSYSYRLHGTVHNFVTDEHARAISDAFPQRRGAKENFIDTRVSVGKSHNPFIPLVLYVLNCTYSARFIRL